MDLAQKLFVIVDRSDWVMDLVLLAHSLLGSNQEILADLTNVIQKQNN